MKAPKHKKKNSSVNILWALDPFEKVKSGAETAGDSIRYLARVLGATVTPVYVLKSHADLPRPIKSHWKENFRDYISTLIQERVEELGLAGIVSSPVVLLQDSFSVQDAVRGFSKHATEVGAQVILSVASEKKGISDLFFEDSFSETLLYESQVPVVILGGRSKVWRNYHPFRILFPVDVRTHSRHALPDVLDLAALVGANVQFLHVIQPPLDFRALPYAIGGFFEPQSVEAYNSKERRNAQNVLVRWVKRAREANIQAEFTIVDFDKDPWVEIVSFSEKNRISLIAMEDKSSHLSASVLGSNTRQVVRHASCPVWVLKRRKRASSAKKSGKLQKQAA